MRALFANEISDGFVVDEKLVRGNETARDAGNESLRENAGQGGCELDANLILLLRGEGVDDAVDRLRGIVGVHGREDEVAGLGGGNGRCHRFVIAHFSHEKHVNVFAEGRDERVGETFGIDAHFALIDD